jgi:hypothetical protein
MCIIGVYVQFACLHYLKQIFLNLFNLYSFNLINFEMVTHIYNNNINIMNIWLFYHNYFTLNCYVVSL